MPHRLQPLSIHGVVSEINRGGAGVEVRAAAAGVTCPLRHARRLTCPSLSMVGPRNCPVLDASQSANEIAFHDKTFATADAMRCGRLHTFLPGEWLGRRQESTTDEHAFRRQNCMPRHHGRRQWLVLCRQSWTCVFRSGWLEANVAFIRSGGYSLSKRISELQPDVLVLWGRHDKILSPSYAEQFAEVLPDSTLRYLERSGHSPQLEEPDAMAAIILDWC